MFTNKVKIGLCVILFLLQSICWGKEISKTGTVAAKFLSFGIGPRAIAMGGSFSSIANDATAMYWNPSGIALITKNQVTFNQTNWIADINLNYIGLVIPFESFGTFGVNVTALTMDDMEVTTEMHPDGTDLYFSAGSYAFGISYARKLTTNFMIGFNLKYIREDISNSRAEGIAVDLGTLFLTPFYGVRFSSRISNFGTKMKISGDDLLVPYDPDKNRAGDNNQISSHIATDAFEIPLHLQIGLSRDFEILEGQAFTLAVDAVFPNDNTQYLNLGSELALMNNRFFLRGGYKTLFMQDAEEGLTLGTGFTFKNLNFLGVSLDYAFQKFKHLGDIHNFGLILEF